ncbi:6-phosphofructokinase [Bacteroidetes bacterium UKL13-3]|jgi:6-phosphofructokinase 1|nr:6-phosphofructokinase [Bacteroidetes bacterium UKL13-3]HCP92497.1 6-phosphofructokinase [Bacteroidota bacterium]
MKKIAVFTSGGDSPGMNACIRAVVRTAIFNKIEVTGIIRGYNGMVENDFMEMDSRSVSNIIQRGGTILKTARSQSFMTKEGRKQAYDNLVKRGIEGIICIGGNGTFTGAKVFYEEYGIPSIGAPGTIDNDLYGTDFTIGFDTAINTAVEAIDRIRDTADSHGRVFFIEVMGRHAGYIALAAGIAGGAEVILVPESTNDWQKLSDYFIRDKSKKAFSIVVVAEGDEQGGAYKIVDKLRMQIPDFDPRVSILGHIQRGGSPTAYDRVLASRIGNAAVEALLRGETNKMAGLINNQVALTSYDDAINKTKQLNADLLRLVDVFNT